MSALEIVQAIGEEVALHDPRFSVRQEALMRKDVRQGMETLLAGNDRQIFDLDPSIYSAILWTPPTHISIFRIPRGFDLTVRAESGYGEKVVVMGAEVVLMEIAGGGELPVINGILQVSPWSLAQLITDRLLMATSKDPDVRLKYLQMRAEEQKEHVRHLEMSRLDDSM